MGGCFKNVFAGIGCLVVLLLAALGAWHFREEIGEAIRALSDRDSSNGIPEFSVGYPSVEALRSAEEKERAIGGPDGPETIVLNGDELASLVRDRLDARAQMALDSMRVTIEQDRFSLEADLLTDVFGRDLLGPLRGMIDPREPIRMSGSADAVAPGIVAWKIDEFVVSSFPFPEPAIPPLVDQLTGGSSGVILISVPATVGDVRVEPEGVTFYRRAS